MHNRNIMAALQTLAISVSLLASAHATPFIFGAGTHLGQNKINAASALSLYAEGGLNSLRDESYWHRMEGKDGKLEFPQSLADLDEVTTKIKAGGGYPLMVLDYSNNAYDGGDIPTSDAAIDAFARYAGFTANYYKGRVQLYEVWNEWNIGMGSNKKPRTIRPVENYIRLLRSTMKAVRAVDPSAKLIAGGVAGTDDKWIDQFISQGGVKGIDGFSVHPYVFSKPTSNRPEDAADWLARLSAKLAAANNGHPIDLYVTEIGWPNHLDMTGWSEQQTADFLWRLYILIRSQPTIRGVWWYELRDSGDNPMEREHRFGLAGKDKRPKLALQAQRIVASLLQDPTKVTIDHPATGVYRAQIKAPKEQCTAYWSRQGTVSYAVPASDRKGRVVWGELSGASGDSSDALTETPYITCRPN